MSTLFILIKFNHSLNTLTGSKNFKTELPKILRLHLRHVSDNCTASFLGTKYNICIRSKSLPIRSRVIKCVNRLGAVILAGCHAIL